MSIVKKNQALETMPGLLKQLITNDLWDWGLSNNSYTKTTIPSVNIRETNDNFEVKMAAPGMDKNDFKIELNNNILTIGSEKENRQVENENGKYSRREFTYQSFYVHFIYQKMSLMLKTFQPDMKMVCCM
jgi:HSP20 family protein